MGGHVLDIQGTVPATLLLRRPAVALLKRKFAEQDHLSYTYDAQPHIDMHNPDPMGQEPSPAYGTSCHWDASAILAHPPSQRVFRYPYGVPHRLSGVGNPMAVEAKCRDALGASAATHLHDNLVFFIAPPQPHTSIRHCAITFCT